MLLSLDSSAQNQLIKGGLEAPVPLLATVLHEFLKEQKKCIMCGNSLLSESCRHKDLGLMTDFLGRQVLRHSRDVHPTWASVDNVTATLRVWDSKSTKSGGDLASF